MNSSSNKRRVPWTSASWRTLFIYVALVGLWFVMSYVVVSGLGIDPTHIDGFEAANAAVFVIVTAVLVAVLPRRMLMQQRQAIEREREALQARERALLTLQEIADSSTDAIFAKDREGRHLLFNREALRVTGTTIEQVLGHDDRALFAPEQAAMVHANDERVMSQDQPHTFEEELDTALGRITFLSTKGPLRDAAGQVVGMFGISRDISERMATQHRLRASEQRYHLLFESNPQPMWAFDPATLRFITVNEAAIAHYGYSRDEFLAMTIADIRPVEERARLAQTLSELTVDPGHATRPIGTWIHRCKDGRLIDVELRTNDLVLDGRAARLVLAHDVTRRLQLERGHDAANAATAAARDLLRDVLARVDDGFVALDLEDRYTYVNARAALMLDRSKPEELVGRHIWTEFPRIVGSSFQHACEQAMREQHPLVVEEYYAAGKRWFEGRLYPSPVGLSIYFTDITLRKRAEDALRLSELRYRLAAAQGQVWDWDMTTGRVDFPAAFWRQLGDEPPPPEANAARFEDLLHPDDVPRWRDALREHLAAHAPYDFEYRARHANGEWHWFRTQGQAVWDDLGRATYMAGTTFDITERKLAQAAQREAEAYRRILIEQLADAVLLIDGELRVLDANPQALVMLGYSRDELLRLRIPNLLSDFEHQRLAPEVGAMMAGQAHLAEWEHLRKDGSRFPAEVSARALDDRRFIAVIRDISVRRASEKALLTFQFELSELAHRLLSQERTTTQRVAQALHDHLGQTLAVARLNLDACVSVHAASMPDALKAQSGRIALLLDQAVREVRQVLAELRPPLLEEHGLAAALDNEIGAGILATGHADVLLEVGTRGAAQRWPGDVEYAAFMVAREAIANARRHARASLIRVVLGGDAGALDLDVIDDGVGIATPMVRGRPGHLGIVGMRERAIAIGARFAVARDMAGGTRVTMRWQTHKP